MGVFLPRFFWDPCKNEWEETGFFRNYGGWLSKKNFFFNFIEIFQE